MSVSHRHKKKRKSKEAPPVELNVMPFLDIFSLLCTFLLFSASFVTIGIHEVQIPFLSNAAPDKKDDDRSLSVKVDIRMENVEVSTSWSKPPVNEENFTFPRDKNGLSEFHSRLIRVRSENKTVDKVTLFVDDGVNYAQIIEVLDQVTTKNENDPGFAANPPPDLKEGEGPNDLFPKVVIGSVML